MAETSNPKTPAAEAAPRRGISPMAAGLVFLGLMMVGLLINWAVSQGGTEISWKTDIRDAFAAARQKNRHVLVVLHEKDCQVFASLESGFLKQRDVREKLARVVCCAVELPLGAPLPEPLQPSAGPLPRFSQSPATIVATADGTIILENQGTLDDKARSRLLVFLTQLAPK